MIGKTLNHYEVIESLGAGGMGEVYRARDTKLARDVAIKVLPAHLADDAERLARMQREAQLLAALNHPNIAAIYGLEEASWEPDGGGGGGGDAAPGSVGGEVPDAGGPSTIHFLAMELAEGQTLAKRLADGALSVDAALKIALQIAEALEAAHEAGIVHRDLKPANIQVAVEGTAAGQVKILDFGLAKAYEPDGSTSALSPDLSASPTMAAAATATGMIMGTAAYMSPEQARGKPVDKRTDIWAFGCVLFETLTGKRAFPGETVTDILAAIVHQEPQWEALPPDTPLRICELLTRCLKKQADERLRDIGECRIAVRQYLADPEGEKQRALEGAGTGAAAGAARGSWKLLVPAVAAALLIGTAATWWAMQPPPLQLMRFDFDYPEGVSRTRGGRHTVAVSPDGDLIVFVANGQLWMRRIGDPEITPIPGTDDDPFSPFFSPDSRQIGYYADGHMKRVAVTGGAAVSLGAIVGAPFGASWADNDMIYFGQGAGGIWQIPGTGGAAEVVIEMEAGEFADGAQLLPGGEWLLFALASSAQGWNDAAIVAQSLVSGDRKLLIPGGSHPRYVPTGHLVYGHTGTLFAVPFDVSRIEAVPGPVSVVEGVRTAGFTGGVDYGFTNDGHLVYGVGTASGFGQPDSSLVWIDRDGNVEALPFDPQSFDKPRLSPDGGRIAVEIRGANDTQIWIYEVERGGTQPLTVEGINENPVWSPDGEWVYFESNVGGDVDIWKRRADRSAAAEPVLEAAEAQTPTSVSANGEFLFFYQAGSMAPDIWMLPLAGEAEPTPLITSAAIEMNASVSPDGRFVAFQSNEGRFTEISVVEIATGSLSSISTAGGNDPVWSPVGDEIFYRRGGNYYVVGVTTEPEFLASSPQQLFGPFVMRNQFDVSADGQRLLIALAGDADQRTEDALTERIAVILNWFEDLKQRVPTRR